MDSPICREDQFNQLYQEVLFNTRIIFVSGPISSGKTTTVKMLFDQLNDSQEMKCAYVFIDNDDSISDVLSEAGTQILQTKKKFMNFHSFVNHMKTFTTTRALIAFDSFDLLGENAHTLFTQALAIVDLNILPNFSFIFISHVNPAYLSLNPLIFTNICFPAYQKHEIEEIITSYYSSNNHIDDLVRKIYMIVSSITTDIRDIIFIAHTLSKLKDLNSPEFGRAVLQTLNKMKVQKTSRISDLPTLASAILLALYIASKTTPMSDLMRFARTLKKRKKKIVLLENHDSVPLERVLAITKALLFSHLDKMDVDYSFYIQIQNLSDHELISIKGDIYNEPKLSLLATEQEILTIAQKLNIHIEEYVTEK